MLWSTELRKKATASMSETHNFQHDFLYFVQLYEVFVLLSALSQPHSCLFSFPFSGFILTSLFSEPLSVKSAAVKFVKLTDLPYKHPSVSMRVKEDLLPSCRRRKVPITTYYTLQRRLVLSRFAPLWSLNYRPCYEQRQSPSGVVWVAGYHGNLPSIAHIHRTRHERGSNFHTEWLVSAAEAGKWRENVSI